MRIERYIEQQLGLVGLVVLLSSSSGTSLTADCDSDCILGICRVSFLSWMNTTARESDEDKYGNGWPRQKWVVNFFEGLFI